MLNIPSFLSKIFKSGSSAGSVEAYLGLGGNLGDSSGYIHRAVKMLDDSNGIVVRDMSSVIRSRPLGGMKQPDYLNAAAKIRTTLKPMDLLEKIQLFEDTLGRVRKEKWAARTIDIDILFYGDRVIAEPNLTVPHGQLHLRSFVLRGLCQLDSGLVHPILGRTVKTLAERLNGQDYVPPVNKPRVISVAGVIGVGKTTLAGNLSDLLGAKLIKEAYSRNPYLQRVCAGERELAIKSQLFFLNSRVSQMNAGKLDRNGVYIADYVFEKELIFAKQTLSQEDYQRYIKEYNVENLKVQPPAVVIYLKDDPQNCLARIRNRGRDFEQNISETDIQKFARDYDRMFEEWKKCPLIKIDVGDFDCRDKAKVKELCKEILMYI